MSVDVSRLREYVKSLRHVGQVSSNFESDDAADEWRAAIRRACRAEHLRIQTFRWRQHSADGTLRVTLLVLDKDHVVTVDQASAATEAIPVPSTWQRADQAGGGELRGDRQQGAGQHMSIFMEITRRDDIGTDLNAPLEARGGVATASYRLVPLVRPGNVVIHYDSRSEAIVGVSVATGPAEPASVFWVSRGSYARRAGEQPGWLRGIRVPLGHYRQLESPLTLTQIRAEKDALFAIRARLQAGASGEPIYFPWIPYQNTLRTFQSYLVRMPQEVISLFPRLRTAVDRAGALSSSLDTTSQVEQAEEAVERAAGKPIHRERGQGFQLDQEVKVAVEVRAMNAATEFYAASWDVEDVHGKESYDLVCRRGDEVKHIEVKGTTSEGIEVMLTPNEVRHAQENRQTALFVLSDIRVERADDGIVTGTGGIHRVYDPWNIDEGILTPIGFRYQVPTQESRHHRA